ncbi:conjugative transposon protein TraM [Bacteroides fragilis]|nr:conjugative transposon protein TraM [Bacteroides fragilis]
MEQTKNETKIENKTESKSESTAAPDNKGKPKKERKPLTEAQRLKRQKMIVLPAMVLVFIGAMWLIFAPSSGKEQEREQAATTSRCPTRTRRTAGLSVTRRKPTNRAQWRKGRRTAAAPCSSWATCSTAKLRQRMETAISTLPIPGGTEEAVKPTPKTIQSSAAAYRDLNATLGNFYEQPKNDNAEMDELLERIATLESELESGKERSSTMDEQVALMEKSYELAAKYMGGQNGTQAAAGQTAEPSPVQKAGKNTAKPVRQVTHQVVSSLGQPVSNAEFVASFSQERNRSFNTAVGVTTVSDRNTIPAYVYGTQSVTDGQAVRLRLLEPMAVADRIIPRNAVVVGAAKIQGERLGIEITSLEHDGTIIPVELEVYDTDGQPGIFIPNSMEMNAVREVAANMGGSLGSSINISTNAGAQLASDLGKGLIQGTSQYIAKKMRTVKVHLKAGYRVMLYQEVN